MTISTELAERAAGVGLVRSGRNYWVIAETRRGVVWYEGIEDGEDAWASECPGLRWSFSTHGNESDALLRVVEHLEAQRGERFVVSDADVRNTPEGFSKLTEAGRQAAEAGHPTLTHADGPRERWEYRADLPVMGGVMSCEPGWEPFAAIMGTGGVLVWLRRRVP